MSMRSPRIGVFDSGVGGLTVLSKLVELMPGAEYHYFGDTARVPYGGRASETIIGYSRQGLNYLASMGADLLVVACNTSSAIALPTLKGMFDIPVIGVVEDGVGVAISHARRGVLVLGTRATVKSGVYQHAIAVQRPDLPVRGVACPLFVPVVEEGLANAYLAEEVVRHYLQSCDDFDYDAILLGCTHFPIISTAIRNFVNKDVSVLDPSARVAERVRTILSGFSISSRDQPDIHFHVTDASESFKSVASMMGFSNVDQVTHVDVAGL